MQHARGFIVGCASGWLWSPGRQSTPNSKLGELYMQHITYGLQGDWLHVCKAVLLVQTARAFFKLRRLRASQLSRGLFTGCTLIGRLHVTRWGGESHHFTETETQVPAPCQPQPRQPHIIKLISQLQKPTRKMSDTWIIDTGKRETRYQLVKIH